MYKGKKGLDHFSCGSDRRGGFVAIKDLGNDRFRIYSKRLSGIVTLSPKVVKNGWCRGIYGAARVACGFCRTPSPVKGESQKE
ncbi:MAG: hypothetical protein GY866_07740 [Proteobacteria bacterium]|nr:hypothetical protein [Pseudomonadota bacterium]